MRFYSNTILQSSLQRLSILMLIMVALVITSCDDYLTIEPKESISDELAIVDRTSLNTALRGAYRALGSTDYYGGTYVLLGFVPSGNVEYQVFNNLQDLNFLPEDASFQSAWSAIYRTINITNHIITKADGIEDVSLTAAERARIVGEARFIRALAYFDLARGFGGVPLKLSPTSNIAEDADLSRSTVDQVYAQVLSDLQVAEELLLPQVNRVRASRYTVWALRARYHLYRQEWEQAAQYASQVIALSGNYSLPTPFANWFRGNVVQGTESIFEIAFSALNTNALRTPMSLQARGGEYRFRPTDNVIANLRRSSTGGGRISLLDSATQSGTKLFAGALYYRSPATDPSYILRLAEQYLIRAEANAHLDNLTAAADDINVVRRRAGLADLPATSEEELVATVLNERRFEFLWESHRYFDLARTGTLKAHIESLKPNLTITDKHYVFPIPSNEVILGGLSQNTGY